MTSDTSRAGWYFLGGVLVFYIITYVVHAQAVFDALTFFVNIMKRIIPVLVLIFAFMALINYFVTPKLLVRFLGSASGWKGWVLAIIGGIISTGPIYLWYPLLDSLYDQGMRHALIAAFLYNRAIKIPLFPLLLTYFSISYAIVLSVVMIFASILQGVVVERLMEV